MATTVVNRYNDDSWTVNIMRPTKWGNAFTHRPLASTMARYKVATREDAVAAYRRDLQMYHPELLAALPELFDQVLGCCCKPQLCHGDVLAELANALQIQMLKRSKLDG